MQFAISCVWMTMALHVYPKKLHINKRRIPIDLHLNAGHVCEKFTIVICHSFSRFDQFEAD